MQIRTVTRDAASEWAESARITGKDIGEVMDRAGVLLTPERLQAIRAICFDQIASLLDATPTSQFTKHRNMTVTDFQGLLANVLRTLGAEERSKT